MAQHVWDLVESLQWLGLRPQAQELPHAMGLPPLPPPPKNAERNMDQGEGVHVFKGM